MQANNASTEASTDELNTKLDEMMDARLSYVAGDISWTEYRLRLKNAKAIVSGQMSQEQADEYVDQLHERGH